MATSGTYNPEQPWQNQIDRDTVQTLLEQWVPDALNQHGFETLWTPKRLIDRYTEGKITRDTTLQVLARYPYLQIPPTPETETFADIPDEGSFEDVGRGARKLRSDTAFYKDVVELKNDPHLGGTA